MLNLNVGYDAVPQQRFWSTIAQNFPFYLQNEIRKRKNGRHLIFEEILAKLDQQFLLLLCKRHLAFLCNFLCRFRPNFWILSVLAVIQYASSKQQHNNQTNFAQNLDETCTESYTKARWRLLNNSNSSKSCFANISSNIK